MSETTPQAVADVPQDAQPPPQQQEQQQTPQPEPQPQTTKQPGYKKPEPRPRKVYDTNLDAWYYNEINKRINQEPELFRNYQINPYTKKTLDYVTPKVNERRKQIPKDPCAPQKDTCSCKNNQENIRPLSEDDKEVLKSYDLIKRAIDRTVHLPQARYCEPQTELMRLGWFPPRAPPPTDLRCMYIKTCWSPTKCFYFHPKPEDEIRQNEMYDERFRYTHQTAEFIRTETQLRKFDAIMNPEGYRGKISTLRKKPGSISGNVALKK